MALPIARLIVGVNSWPNRRFVSGALFGVTIRTTYSVCVMVSPFIRHVLLDRISVSGGYVRQSCFLDHQPRTERPAARRWLCAWTLERPALVFRSVPRRNVPHLRNSNRARTSLVATALSFFS